MFEDELTLLNQSINEFGDKFRNIPSGNPSQMLGLRDAFKDSLRALSGTALTSQPALLAVLPTDKTSAELRCLWQFVFQKSCL